MMLENYWQIKDEHMVETFGEIKTVESSRHFARWELKCPCCGKSKMDVAFMQTLERIRVEFGKPMTVNSGYRCPSYNSRVSDTGPKGPHTTGKAADIKTWGSGAHELISIALEEGVMGIGISQKGAHDRRFIHIDTLDEPNRPWVWGY